MNSALPIPPPDAPYPAEDIFAVFVKVWCERCGEPFDEQWTVWPDGSATIHLRPLRNPLEDYLRMCPLCRWLVDASAQYLLIQMEAKYGALSHAAA